jgi:hypothetical protein
MILTKARDELEIHFPFSCIARKTDEKRISKQTFFKTERIFYFKFIFSGFRQNLFSFKHYSPYMSYFAGKERIKNVAT